MKDKKLDPLQGTVDFESTNNADAAPNETVLYKATEATNPESRASNSKLPTIPGYAITSEIAKGGMGAIYAARDLILDRNVAIKTLLPGANANRFLAEAKITAKLSHPSIPPIHALGTASNGAPFLAMKRIVGRTLAEELEERSSPSEDLLRFVMILEQIAQAVGFAHSQGIIHRDLKPLNVMVGEFGEVQVMDWGLAKELRNVDTSTLNSDLQLQPVDNPSQTLAGAVMGTPGYMAPEQARGDEVDARVDVFALGAILGVILTGQPAFAASTVLECIKLAVRGDLSNIYARLDSCEQNPELISIAKQCLAADRTQRPDDGHTVAKLIATYRANVDSRLRQTETEKAEVLVREREERKRHKQLKVAALCVSLTLLSGLTASLWQMRRATLAETQALENAANAKSERDAKEQARRAEQQRAEGERIAKETAERNLEYARNGNDILGSVFGSLDPSADYQSIAELRDALKSNLKRAIESVEGTSVGDPLEVAQLQDNLGRSLLGLGQPNEAIEILLKSVQTRETLLGSDDPKTLASRNNLAESYRAAGMLDKAIPIYEETFQRASLKLGPTHKDTLASMNNLSVGYQAAGMLTKAMPLYEKALLIRRESLGVEHSDTLATMSNLATGYYALGDYASALPLFEETFAVMKRTLGPDHLSTLTAMNNLGAIYFKTEAYDRGLPLFAESLELRREKLGATHPETLATMRNLGIAYCRTEQGAKAASVLKEYVDLQRTMLPENDAKFAIVLAQNGTDLLNCKQFEFAEPMLRECLKLRQATTPDQWNTFNSSSLLGASLLGQAKYDEAEPLLIQGYEGMVARRETIPQIASNRIIESLDRLIELYQRTNRQEQLSKYETERENLLSSTNIK